MDIKDDTKIFEELSRQSKMDLNIKVFRTAGTIKVNVL